jgi:four helix bundle protein
VTSDKQERRRVTSNKQEIGGYKELLVWQKGIALVKQVYLLTREFPGDEKFGLVSQLRRAAVSIPSNIAEGQARNTTGEFVQFISYAEGSVAEVETQLIIAIEIGYCSRSATCEAFELLSELRRMLNSLRRKLVTRR